MNSCTVEYLRQQILGEMVGFISVFSGFISKWKVKEIFEGLLKSVYIGQSYHKEKSGTVFYGSQYTVLEGYICPQTRVRLTAGALPVSLGQLNLTSLRGR